MKAAILIHCISFCSVIRCLGGEVTDKPLRDWERITEDDDHCNCKLKTRQHVLYNNETRSRIKKSERGVEVTCGGLTELYRFQGKSVEKIVKLTLSCEDDELKARFLTASASNPETKRGLKYDCLGVINPLEKQMMYFEGKPSLEFTAKVYHGSMQGKDVKITWNIAGMGTVPVDKVVSVLQKDNTIVSKITMKPDYDKQRVSLTLENEKSKFVLDTLIVYFFKGEKPTRQCLKESIYPYMWSQAEEGNEQRFRCVNIAASFQMVSRTCTATGWSNVDYSQCQKLCSSLNDVWKGTYCEKLVDELHNITKDVTEENAGEIIHKIEELTEEGINSENSNILIEAVEKCNEATNYQNVEVFNKSIKILDDSVLGRPGLSTTSVSLIVDMVEDFQKKVNFSGRIEIESSSVSLYLTRDTFPDGTRTTASRSGVFFPPEITANHDVVLSHVFYDEVIVQRKFSGPLERNSVLGSQVVNVEVRGKKIQDLIRPVEITIPQNSFPRSSQVKCVWLNKRSESWEIAGCTSLPMGRVVKCSCDHLTNFALMMVPHEDGVDNAATTILSFTCLTLSVMGSGATVFTILSLRHLRKSRSSQIHLNLAVAVLGASLSHIVGDVSGEVICLAAAFLKQVFYLAVMTWSLSEAITMYIAFVTVFGSQWSLWHVMLPSWGAPLAIGVMTMLLDAGEYSKATCWLTPSSIWWSFLGFTYAIILTNIVLFILILRGVYRSKTKNSDAFAKLRQAVAVMVLLGVGWSLGALLSSEEIASQSFMSYIFIVVNAPQGLYIFLFHIVTRPDVRTAWKKVLFNKDSHSSTTSTFGRSITGSTAVGRSTIIRDYNSQLVPSSQPSMRRPHGRFMSTRVAPTTTRSVPLPARRISESCATAATVTSNQVFRRRSADAKKV